MARQKTAALIRLEYAAMRGLLVLLSSLPRRVSEWLTRRMLHGVLRLIPKRRRLILRQIQASFPGKTEAECQWVADQSVDFLAKGISSFARIPDMTEQSMESWVQVEGLEHLRAALARGKGVITFTAHYGFWELMAIYITRLYPEVSMVVRPLDNPWLDAMVAGIRGRGGGGVIDSRRVLKEGIRLLRRNGILGILIDQNFHKGGEFVNFFGRPAATSTLVPILAQRTGCALLPMHNVWTGDRIRIITEPPVFPSTAADPHEAIRQDTQRLTTIVEGWIREDSRQWLWLHNRWKRTPQAA